MPEIHPTALIDPTAELAENVCVGPYAIVEKGVRLGRGTVVEAHAQLLTGTETGDECTIGRAAILGGAPQSLSFDPRLPSGVKIGNRNRIREHVTIHRSMLEGRHTLVGDDNFIMVGAHLGHDAVLGSQTVLANAVLIAGHVEIGNQVFIGGGSGIHQFLRIGDFAMIQGNSAISMDVPPHCMAARGNVLVGLNSVGLKRAGLSPEARQEIRNVFELLFRSGMNLSQSITAARKRPWGPEAEKLVRFVETRGAKGICRPNKTR